MNEVERSIDQTVDIDTSLDDLSSILDWVRWCTSQMSEHQVYFGHGTDNPWDESVALVLQSLQLPFDYPSELYSARLTKSEKTRIIDFLKQRIEQRKPLAYITNQAYFHGLPFYVDDRVLVPRSPISELIEARFEPFIDAQQVDSILDLCTGSGCIAIACATEFEEAFVLASDISIEALEVAQINVEQHELEERVGLIQSDVFAGIPNQQFDIIVSNPPYVDAEDLADMPLEYHSEPEIGLGSGLDGLDITRQILREASEFLTENGVLIVEVGNSWPALQEAYPDVDFQWLEFERGGDGVFLLTRDQLLEHSF
ncbi:MAG: 50S ribosomal protein L3 N(5)-glutamine methyltransferase [Gammaproteobacteria bacterium]|nr:50S ribosomal protein L3 N(5)-glutamine methyltransferase [Gammaproteobacteria bacterium]